jgi:hypothetical protein
MRAQTLDQLAGLPGTRLKTGGPSDFRLIDKPLLPSLEFSNDCREGPWDGTLLHS